jgi:hypothetical protein
MNSSIFSRGVLEASRRKNRCRRRDRALRFSTVASTTVLFGIKISELSEALTDGGRQA